MRNPTHTQCSTTEGLAPENRLTERLVGWKIHDARLILYWLNTQKSWNRSRRGVWTGDWCHASQCWERYALVDEKVSNVGGVRSQTPMYTFQGSHGINSQNPQVPTHVNRVNKIECFPIHKCFGFYTNQPSSPAARFRLAPFLVLRSQNFAGMLWRGSSVDSKHSRNSCMGWQCNEELLSSWQPMDRRTSIQSLNFTVDADDGTPVFGFLSRWKPKWW